MKKVKKSMKKIYSSSPPLYQAMRKIHYLFIAFYFKIKLRLNRIALSRYSPSS